MKYLYFARLPHGNEEVAGENILEFCAGAGIPAREIVLNVDGRLRSELGVCLADAAAIVSPMWHLDHSCIGDRIFLDVATEARVPVIQWFLDHPSMRWPEFVYSTAENSRFLFESAYAEAYFRTFIMPDCRSAWMVTSGPSRNARAAALTLDSYLARDIACLVPMNMRRIAGTIEDIEQKRQALPSDVRELARGAIEAGFNDLQQPNEAFLLPASPARFAENPDLLHRCVHLVTDAIQLRRRLHVFEVAQQFPVLLQSDIALAYLAGERAARLEEGVSMKETLRRMPRSRSVISLTHVHDSIHNRVLNALNAGAIPIVEDNKANREIFTHGQNALVFRYDDDSLREALSLVCSAPAEAFKIAEAGFAMRDDPRLRFGGFHRLVELAA